MRHNSDETQTNRDPARSWVRIGRRMLAAAAATLALTFDASSIASALPPAGASPDSPGTSSTVSSRSVSAGEPLSFTVTGFPANRQISVKIADGQYCGQGVRYGSCVVTRVQSDARGRASGTIVIPNDLTAGSYWLRFLTDTPATSNRGNSEFKVVPKSASSAQGGSATVEGGGSAMTQQVEQQKTVGDGAVLMVPAPDPAQAAKSVTDDELPIAGGASNGGSSSVDSSAAADSSEAAQSADQTAFSKPGFPWAGTVVFAVTLLLVAAGVIAVLVWPVRSKRPE